MAALKAGLVGAGNDLTLNIASTITIADGSGVNNLMSVGETVLTGTITTTGSQTYQSNVTIEGDVTINAGGEVVFEGRYHGCMMRSDTLWLGYTVLVERIVIPATAYPFLKTALPS